jgi:Tol biopolymer transport system component
VNTLVAAYASVLQPHFRFSDDGRFLVYAASSSKTVTNQVYLYDAVTKTNFLVSHGFGSSAGANAGSDVPELSPDGRFVAFRSAASDLVPGANPAGLPNVLLYDRQTDVMMLVSASAFAVRCGDNRSSDPTFSADGHTLLFSSWASNLKAGDQNYGNDLFALSLAGEASTPSVSLQLTFDAGLAWGPTLSWSVWPGKSYRVQFGDSLLLTNWQDLGSAFVIGTQGFLHDTNPIGQHRFYRLATN